MRINAKFLGISVAACLLLFATGCSGINATGSVSPATFLLPGFGQVDPTPAPAAPEGSLPSLNQLAQVD